MKALIEPLDQNMPLVAVHHAMTMPEALVIESMLVARGVPVFAADGHLIWQCPHCVLLFGGIRILVDERDVESAQSLICAADNAPGLSTRDSRAFALSPIRNSLLAAVLLFLFHVPLPVWSREWRDADTPGD